MFSNRFLSSAVTCTSQTALNPNPGTHSSVAHDDSVLMMTPGPGRLLFTTVLGFVSKNFGAVPEVEHRLNISGDELITRAVSKDSPSLSSVAGYMAYFLDIILLRRSRG